MSCWECYYSLEDIKFSATGLPFEIGVRCLNRRYRPLGTDPFVDPEKVCEFFLDAEDYIGQYYVDRSSMSPPYGG